MAVSGGAVVDVRRLEANIRAFHEEAATAGVGVRWHVKGHRMPDVARLQARWSRAMAVTSATEARRYLQSGAGDVVIAYPWRDPWRWRLFARLAARCATSVHVDCPEAVYGLAEQAAVAGAEVGIRVEVDTGHGGRGVTPDQAADLARAVAEAPWLRLEGVTGYAGPETRAELASRFDLGRHHAAVLVRVARQLRRRGLPCQVVCAGGTVTAAGAMSVPGVTEITAGAYALLDAGLAAAEVCTFADIAISVTGTGALDLLDGCAQPWTAQDLTAYSTNGHPHTRETTAPPGRPHTDDSAGTTPRTGDRGSERMFPAHVCALVRRLDRVVAVDGTEVIGEWAVLRTPDRVC